MSAAIPLLGPSDYGAIARTTTNAAIGLANSLSTSLDAEAAARTAADLVVAGVAFNPDTRPGDNPQAFGSTTTGPGLSNAPLGAGVTSFDGAVYRVTGAAIVAPRGAAWLEPGRVYLVRFAYRRFATPSDPAGDTIRVGIAFLDANLALISTAVISDANAVTPSSGLQVVSASVPSQAGDPVSITPPGGTVYMRPYVQTFGLDGVTDIVSISREDVTDASAYPSPDLSALQSQVTAIQSYVHEIDPLIAGVASGLATLDPLAHLPPAELDTPYREAVFPTLAAAEAFTGQILGNNVRTLGGGAMNDGGAFTATLVSAAPAHPAYLRANAKYFENAEGVLTPQMLRRNWSGSSDWTQAFSDAMTAAVAKNCPLFIPKGAPVAGTVKAAPYTTGPLTIPAVSGFKMYGVGETGSVLSPINDAQSFILLAAQTCYDVTLSDLGFFDNTRSGSALVQNAFISDAVSIAYDNLRVDTAGNGIWFRRGGYGKVSNLYIASAANCGLITGGAPMTSGNPVQFAELAISDVVVDAREGAPNPTTQAVAWDCRSGSAFMYMDRFTAAGQGIGIRIYDSATGGNDLTTRPDGINITSANLDYENQQALQIISAGLVKIYRAQLRSVYSYAMTAEGFGYLYLDAQSEAYASHLGGIQIGNVNDFGVLYLDGSKVTGNGYPSNTGGIGIHLAAGTGTVALINAESRNAYGADTAFGTQLQDYNLVVEPGYTGLLRLDGGRYNHGRLANIAGLTQSDGTLRPNTQLSGNIDGFRTDNAGLAGGATITSSVITIPHGLAIKPGYAEAHIVSATGSLTYSARVRSWDATNIYVQLIDSSGTTLASGSADIGWSAKLTT